MLGRSGVIRLFQVSGITVFLHWSWLLVAVFEIGGRTGTYSSFAWNVLEYLALFGIVTVHEFGHALACRSVGGRADRILLWPFGGIAIVDPPPLPGAMLWSIAAGPLVNVALLPLLGGLTLLIPAAVSPNIHAFLRSLTFINAGLLLFNLLPIYPLDGGQILGALLWFLIGRTRSMMVTAIIGLIGVVGIGWLAISSFSLWLGFIALFVARQCLHSIHVARTMNSMASGPHRTTVACPSCHRTPPIGPYWRCDSCKAAFDVFDPAAGAAIESGEITTLSLSAGSGPAAATETDGSQCPVCHAEAATVRCIDCLAVTPVADWSPTAVLSSSSSDVPDVTRFRRPRSPSVGPIVLGVCAAIVALMVIFVAIFVHAVSLRRVDVDGAAFMRHMAVGVLVFSLLPGGASILFFLRYRRIWKAFAVGLPRS